MAELFGQHKMHKSYFALVKETEGQSLPKKFSVKGLITKTPTAKHPFYFSMHATQGQFSETQFQVLQKGQDLTLLQCFPLTGRSHQIRVHLKHYGVPILGDPFYGRGAKEFSRLALHSHSLKFKHPLSKADLEILSPLPSSFSDALNDASS